MYVVVGVYFFFFKQQTAYEVRISDWSSDVCSSELDPPVRRHRVLDLLEGVVGHVELDDIVQEARGHSYRVSEGLVIECTVCSHELAKVDAPEVAEIGRASCRERVCQYG